MTRTAAPASHLRLVDTTNPASAREIISRSREHRGLRTHGAYLYRPLFLLSVSLIAVYALMAASHL